MSILSNIRIAGKIAWHDTMPEQVTMFVTNKCNLQCSHCFYHESINKQEQEFTVAELERLAGTMGSFSFLSLGGGEPFLRNDIAQIAEVFTNKCGVKRISIPTNGLLTDKIIENTRGLLDRVQGAEVLVKVSIDGLENTHNRIRGNAGSFNKAVDTVMKLKALKAEYNNLKVGVLVTMSAQNQGEINSLMQYVKESLVPDVIGLNYIRGEVKNSGLKDISTDTYKNAYKEVLKDKPIKPFYAAYKAHVADTIEKIKKGGRYPMDCYAGSLSAVIDSSLNVYPCESLKESMGNLRDFGYDFRRLWSSQSAQKTRSFIKSKNCTCTNECNIQINSFFNIKHIAKLGIQTLISVIAGNIVMKQSSFSAEKARLLRFARNDS